PVSFSPADFGIAPNNLEAIDTAQLLGLVVARQALEDAGYSVMGNGEWGMGNERPPQPSPSDSPSSHSPFPIPHSPLKHPVRDSPWVHRAGRRVSVAGGVRGTLELATPLGARLGHPLWRRALREGGVAEPVAEDVVRRIADGYVGWQENSFPGLLGNVVAGR